MSIVLFLCPSPPQLYSQTGLRSPQKMPLRTHRVSRPEVSSIRGCPCLSEDALAAQEDPLRGDSVMGGSLSPSEDKLPPAVLLTWAQGPSLPGATKVGGGGGVGGRRGAKKGCEMEEEAGNSDPSLSPHRILPPAPRAPIAY